jgi:hypothetical protein
VKATHVILDITLRLFICGVGYSHFMCIYAVPRGGYHHAAAVLSEVKCIVSDERA